MPPHEVDDDALLLQANCKEGDVKDGQWNSRTKERDPLPGAAMFYEPTAHETLRMRAFLQRLPVIKSIVIAHDYA